MIKLLKIISLFYLIALSIALLIPLDVIINTQTIEAEDIPSTNTSFLIHLVLFFILYLLLSLTFLNTFKIFLFCIIYSIIIETLQIFTTRSFQISDIIFNLIGIISSYLFYYFVIKKLIKY